MTRDQLTVTVDADTYVELVQAQKKLAALTSALRTLRSELHAYDEGVEILLKPRETGVVNAARALLAGLHPDDVAPPEAVPARPKE